MRPVVAHTLLHVGRVGKPRAGCHPALCVRVGRTPSSARDPLVAPLLTSKRLFLLPFLSALITFAAPTASAPANPLDNPGFVYFYNNEYDQALAVFENQVKAHPEDATLYNGLAQTILFREMYRNGALESQMVTGSNAFLHRPKMGISAAERTRFYDTIDRAIALSEARLRRNPKDVNAMHALAVAHGLKANFLFTVDKAWMQALHEAISSRKVNDRIRKLDPGFVDAHLIHGVSEYVVSCLPAYLRFWGALKGFHADKEDGIRQLQLVAASGVRSRYDAAILLAVIYRRERRPADAIPLLKSLANTFPRNYLFRFEEVQMYSDLGDKASALRVLGGIEDALRRGQPGYTKLPLERVQYARGNLLFWYNDLPHSLENLRQATQRTDDLDLNTATMAWLRLGQVYDLMRDRQRALEAYHTAMSTAPGSDIAKEAANYVEKPYQRKVNSNRS
jgi:tetratricopeptide (TPR) repeat protein